MRAVIQRVKQAKVEVLGEVIGKIQEGLLVFLGVGQEDTYEDCHYIAEKVAHLRIFQDVQDKMNLSVLDTKGDILLISQFTLYGDARKGRRPSFSDASAPEWGATLYEKTASLLREKGIRVETGQFQAHMMVDLMNDGPVTILLDSKKQF